jgi:hypothetical protein
MHNNFLYLDKKDSIINDIIINDIINIIYCDNMCINKLIEYILFLFTIYEYQNVNNKYNLLTKLDIYNQKKISIIEFEKIMNLFEKIKNFDKKNSINQIINIIKISQNKKLIKYQKEINILYKKINFEIIFNFYNLNNENILFLNSPLIFLEDNLLDIYGNKKIDIIDLEPTNISLLKIYNNFIENDINCQNKDYIHENCINKLYDLIISYFPEGIKNIIHAECCERIKKLKIRGTKSEPLILQLIMSSLEQNGDAIVIIPNSLLFNDSKQHIETRKYLLENFNVICVISLDNSNNSLIYFKNNGITKNIDFKIIKNEEIKLIKIIDINNIKFKNYNLFYEKYNYLDKNINIELTTPLYEIINIVTNENINTIDKNQSNFLVFSKYFNENGLKLIFNELILEKDSFTLIIKDKNKCLQKYLNYYLFNNLIKDKNLITTGKLNKIDIDLLLNYKIALPSLKIQTQVSSYYDINNELINDNLNQITLYKQMINKLINISVVNVEKIQLSEICSIKTLPDDDTFIYINKNSNLVGNVNLYTIKHEESTNFYYIGNIKNFNKKCLYYLLKNEESSLYKLSSMTQNINLSRKNLESFEINNLQDKTQEYIIKECDKFSNLIDSLFLTNEYLKNINIFDIILSLN